MNAILFQDEDISSSGEIVLFGRRALHVREVHRVKPGDVRTAGRLGGDVGRATVLAVDDASVTLRFEATHAPPPPIDAALLVAMPRPKVLRRLLAAVTSMGVKRIALVNASKVERSYFGSPFLKPDSMREQLLLGLEQGVDTVLPTVRVFERFRPFVEDELDAFFDHAPSRLVAHTGDAGPIPSHVGPTVVAIGPEGGWVPFELDLLEKQGFQRFSLGTRILRVDTAACVALGALGVPRTT